MASAVKFHCSQILRRYTVSGKYLPNKKKSRKPHFGRQKCGPRKWRCDNAVVTIPVRSFAHHMASRAELPVANNENCRFVPFSHRLGCSTVRTRDLHCVHERMERVDPKTPNQQRKRPNRKDKNSPLPPILVCRHSTTSHTQIACARAPLTYVGTTPSKCRTPLLIRREFCSDC